MLRMINRTFPLPHVNLGGGGTIRDMRDLCRSGRKLIIAGTASKGLKQGEGFLLHVTPTKPDLPALKYFRRSSRTLRSSWLKAVGVVARYIDDAFMVLAVIPIWN